MQEVKFARGADVIKQGDAGETFYIVKTGVVKVTQIQEGGSRPETIKEGLSSGDYFGEMALLESQPRMATVTATSDDVVLMSLDRATFTSLLGPLGNILNREVCPHAAPHPQPHPKPHRSPLTSHLSPSP